MFYNKYMNISDINEFFNKLLDIIVISSNKTFSLLRYMFKNFFRAVINFSKYVLFIKFSFYTVIETLIYIFLFYKIVIFSIRFIKGEETMIESTIKILIFALIAILVRFYFDRYIYV